MQMDTKAATIATLQDDGKEKVMKRNRLWYNTVLHQLMLNNSQSEFNMQSLHHLFAVQECR